MRGITEALVDGVNESDEATLRSLHEEVLRLTQLVSDLETLAAADAASLQLHRRPCDLGADTGPGIDVEDLPRVFERFYRSRATAGPAGSGIGLAVALDLVTAHGGTITAANPDAGGAVFTVTLPAR